VHGLLQLQHRVCSCWILHVPTQLPPVPVARLRHNREKGKVVSSGYFHRKAVLFTLDAEHFLYVLYTGGHNVPRCAVLGLMQHQVRHGAYWKVCPDPTCSCSMLGLTCGVFFSRRSLFLLLCSDGVIAVLGEV
jgi:hypothetical protein